MTENHTADGNEDLRQAIQDRWTHVGLVDDTGSEEVRIDIKNDNRAEYLDAASQNPMTLEVEVSGSDSDITTPVTLKRSELYPDSSSNNSYSGDDFDEGPASLGSGSDTLVVTHDVSQPK